MNREGKSDPGRPEASRTSFWAGILVLALIGMTICCLQGRFVFDPGLAAPHAASASNSRADMPLR
jgi:hypothetical protein